MREPQRNLPRSLALGLAICTTVYLLANLAYLRQMNTVEIAASERVAADMAQRAAGPAGASLFAAAILISILGSSNGWMLTAPRVYFAQARDGIFFRRFGEVHPRWLTPAWSTGMQAVWASALVVSGAYASLGAFVMFATWLFYGLAVAGVIILRRRDPARLRPYRMWGYPATPLAFCVVALGFVLNTLVTDPGPALSALGLMAAGLPAYWLWRRR